MDALASAMMRAISQSKQKTVMVLDFEGPNERVTALGQTLAHELSEALSRSATGFIVIGRDRLDDIVVQNGLARASLKYPDIAFAMADQLKSRLAIRGKLGSVKENGVLEIIVDCYRMDSGKDLDEWTLGLPLTENVEKLLVDSEDPRNLPGVGKWSKDDLPFSKAVCVECPNASFTQSAIDHKAEGIVLISALVGTDGKLSDIYPVQALPYGLTWSAAHTVHSWKLKPAENSNGDRISVGQTIEVVFHLY
jgi:hypothetical protein